MQTLYQDFVSKLKKIYGSYDKEHRRFTKSSNSDISRELGYSDAQFSRLINESATEGEYQRAIQNIERIIKIEELQNEIGGSSHKKTWYSRPIILVAGGFLFATVIWLVLYWIKPVPKTDESFSKYDMLEWSFETSFVNPYTKLNDLPSDCDFPCYRYQGKWVLKNEYKIPFFRERSGFHYLAKEVVMYARCSPEASKAGDVIEGYEYQKHEIWYDKRELPVDSFIRDDNKTLILEQYKALDFNQDKNYVMVATVHTFFRNKFTIGSDSLHRTGKVVGRNLEFTEREDLKKHMLSNTKIEEIQSELNYIASNRLQDFSRPISCEDIPLSVPDFHKVKDGDEISFNCQLTTSRVPIGYTKTYQLVDQFIKTSCRTE